MIQNQGGLFALTSDEDMLIINYYGEIVQKTPKRGVFYVRDIQKTLGKHW